MQGVPEAVPPDSLHPPHPRQSPRTNDLVNQENKKRFPPTPSGAGAPAPKQAPPRAQGWGPSSRGPQGSYLPLQPRNTPLSRQPRSLKGVAGLTLPQNALGGKASYPTGPTPQGERGSPRKSFSPNYLTPQEFNMKGRGLPESAAFYLCILSPKERAYSFPSKDEKHK